MNHWSWPPCCLIVAAAAATVSDEAASAPMGCTARSGARAASVVELYTSEGCNSCPPADRWLSALKNNPEVVALAFHVDYWDRLGWKDRFASPAFTRRQVEQLAVNGARFAYTPQVVVNGQDRKDWPRLQIGGATIASTVDIALSREGERLSAEVSATGKAPAQLAAFWAVTESNHRTAVKAGENEGVMLAHDFVVREWVPTPAWVTVAEPSKSLKHLLRAAEDPALARRVSLIVVDAASGRPVQALSLGC